MTKLELIDKLEKALIARGLAREEAIKSVQFCAEGIDDRIEDGMTEEDAVAALGEVDDIVEQILLDQPLGTLIKSKFKESTAKLRTNPLWIVLAILGAPLWLPILFAVFSVFVSVYLSVFSVVISLFAVVAAIGVSGLLMIPAAFFAYGGSTLGMIAVGLVLMGLSILLYFPIKMVAKLLIRFTVLFVKAVKSLFTKPSGKGELQ